MQAYTIEGSGTTQESSSFDKYFKSSFLLVISCFIVYKSCFYCISLALIV